jgi:uncharacterized protein YggE
MKLILNGIRLPQLAIFALAWVWSPAQGALLSGTDKRVTVSGQCVLETTPDRGAIQFTAEVLHPDAKIAIQKATELHEKLRDELKRTKIKNLELSTSEYSVQERKEWENQKNVSKGFAARLGLRASTSEIAALGEMLTIAARVGIKETSGLSLYLSDSKGLEEKKKCLDLAAKNAKEKADTLAKSLGAKVGPALQIIERSNGATTPPGPLFEGAMMKSAAADTAPTIEGRKLTVSQDIEVTFSLE